MRLHVTHETRYAYTPPVETAQHLAHLKPLTTPSQQLVSHALEVTPTPAQRSESIDVFGNTRAFFALDSTHDELVVVAHSVVDTAPPAHAEALPESAAWDEVQARLRFAKGQPFDAAVEFSFPSRYVPRHEDFAAYARPSFTPGRPLAEAAMDLTLRMYADFEYDADSTEISTPAIDALAQRRGVCQDFAHIMLACLRTLGLPARYVSGYLLTQQPPGQPRLIGADASHAWVSAYVPGAQGEAGTGEWIEFDPTNGRRPGEDYVVLAYGRDYSDVSPMRGVLHGGARHTLDVRVTVQPAHEPPAVPRASVPARPSGEASNPSNEEPSP